MTETESEGITHESTDGSDKLPALAFIVAFTVGAVFLATELPGYWAYMVGGSVAGVGLSLVKQVRDDG